MSEPATAPTNRVTVPTVAVTATEAATAVVSYSDSDNGRSGDECRLNHSAKSSVEYSDTARAAEAETEAEAEGESGNMHNNNMDGLGDTSPSTAATPLFPNALNIHNFQLQPSPSSSSSSGSTLQKQLQYHQHQHQQQRSLSDMSLSPPPSPALDGSFPSPSSQSQHQHQHQQKQQQSSIVPQATLPIVAIEETPSASADGSPLPGQPSSFNFACDSTIPLNPHHQLHPHHDIHHQTTPPNDDEDDVHQQSSNQHSHFISADDAEVLNIMRPQQMQQQSRSSFSRNTSNSVRTLDGLLLDSGHSHRETPLPAANMHVDYLTHNWNGDELIYCWKTVTRRKDYVANGPRLENASWRIWAKCQGNLGTMRPELLNWFKDNDLLWLYGPLFVKPATSNNNNNQNGEGSVMSPPSPPSPAVVDVTIVPSNTAVANSSSEVKPMAVSRSASSDCILNTVAHERRFVAHSDANIHPSTTTIGIAASNPGTASRSIALKSVLKKRPPAIDPLEILAAAKFATSTFGHHGLPHTAINSPNDYAQSQPQPQSQSQSQSSSQSLSQTPSNEGNPSRKHLKLRFNNAVEQCIAIDDDDLVDLSEGEEKHSNQHITGNGAEFDDYFGRARYNHNYGYVDSSDDSGDDENNDNSFGYQSTQSPRTPTTPRSKQQQHHHHQYHRVPRTTILRIAPTILKAGSDSSTMATPPVGRHRNSSSTMNPAQRLQQSTTTSASSQQQQQQQQPKSALARHLQSASAHRSMSGSGSARRKPYSLMRGIVSLLLPTLLGSSGNEQQLIDDDQPADSQPQQQQQQQQQQHNTREQPLQLQHHPYASSSAINIPFSSSDDEDDDMYSDNDDHYDDDDHNGGDDHGDGYLSSLDETANEDDGAAVGKSTRLRHRSDSDPSSPLATIQGQHYHSADTEKYSMVDHVQDIATNVQEIVGWCTSMVLRTIY